MTNITGGNLYSLWKIANVALPRVAAVYSSASGDMNGTQGTSGSFQTGSGDHGPIMSPIYPEFAKLRDEFQHILADTARNLIDSQAAVQKAIEDFTETDSQSGRELDKILKGKEIDGTQYHDPNDPNMNPPSDTNGDHIADPVTPPKQPYDGYTNEGDQKVPDSNGDGKIDQTDIAAHTRKLEQTRDDLNGMKDK